MLGFHCWFGDLREVAQLSVYLFVTLFVCLLILDTYMLQPEIQPKHFSGFKVRKILIVKGKLKYHKTTTRVVIVIVYLFVCCLTENVLTQLACA